MNIHHLFSPSAYKMDINELKKTLGEKDAEKAQELLHFIRNEIGAVKRIDSHPYRVSRQNYVKLIFHSAEEDKQFNLTLVIAGFTEWPNLVGTEEKPLSPRLYVNVMDSVDAYWLIQYFNLELLEPGLSTETVHNSAETTDEITGTNE